MWLAAPTNGNWVPGAGNNWSTGAGTFPGSTAGSTNNPDIATFNGPSTQTTVQINGGVLPTLLNLSGITFTGAAADHTIGFAGGEALWMSSGGAIQIDGGLTSSGSVQTVNADLVFTAGANYTLTNNSANGGGANSGTLVINGDLANPAIGGGAAGSVALTLAGTNTNNNAINGDISNGDSGTTSVLKTASGTWVLGGTNTYTGGTTVNDGNLTLNGSTTGSNWAVTGTGTLSGTGTLTGNLNYTSSNSSTFNGVIAGAGSTVTMNNGDPTSGSFFRLSGANTYGGVTTVTSGQLVANNNAALGSTAGGTVVASGGTLTVNGGINIGSEALTIAGTGVTTAGNPVGALLGGGLGGGTSTVGGLITLSGDALIGTNTGAVSTFNLNGGIATAGNTVTLGGSFGLGGNTINVGGAVTGAGNVIIGIGTANTGTVNFNANNTYAGTTTVNDGTLNLNAPGANSAVSGLSLTIGDNVGAANSALVRNLAAEQINNAAPVAIVSDGRLDLNNFNETIGSLAGGGNVTLGSGNLTTGGNNGNTTFAGVISGTGGVTKTGAGTFTLSGANTYTGATAVNQGQLNLTGSITSNTTVSNTGTLAGNGTLTGNLNYTSSNASTFNGVIAGAGSTVTMNNGDASGAAFLRLSGANTYGGLTTVTSGQLVANNNAALGSTAAGTVVANGAMLTINAGINVGAEALTLNGTGTGGGIFGALIGGGNVGGTSGYAGAITLASSATIGTNGLPTVFNLTGGINTAGNALTLGSTALAGNIINVNTNGISGTGNVIIDSDIINYDVANTYTGSTSIINGGVLNVGVAGALPNRAVILDAVGTGSSTLNIGGTTTNPAGASHTIGSLDGAASSAVTLGANTLTTGSNGQPATFAGVISGTGGLTKFGGGTQTLSGVNTYSGLTNVQAGTLTIGGAGSITNSSAVNVNGGATLVLSAGNNNQLGNGITVTLNANNGAGSTLTLGGTETIGTLTDFGTGGSNINGTGTLTANTINLDNTTTQVGADLFSNNAINVAASNGTTNLAGATTSTTFNVNGGTVNLTNNGNTTTTADLNIANNATFNALGGVLDANPGTIDLVGPNSNLRIDGNDDYGSLRGIGVVNGGGTAFRNNAGRNLRPGDANGVNTIGTLTTGGNYRESGNLFIQFNSNAVGPLAPGTSDNIAVGGLASIDNSSSLRLTDTGATVVGIGQRYNIINTGTGGLPGGPVIGDADGGAITGFGEITDGNNTGINGVTDPNQFFFDRGTGNIVGLGLINNQGPSAYAGIAPNQTAILTALTTTATDAVGNYNSADTGAGTALDLVYGGPAPGGPITPAQLLANINQLSPESYAGTLDYTLQATRNYVRNATRTSAPDGGSAAIRRTPTSFGDGSTPTTIGADVFAGFTYLDVESDSSIPSQNYQLQSMGGYAGVRMSTSANVQLGAFLAVDDGSVESTGLDLSVDGMVFGVFGRYDQGPFHAILSGSFSEYEFSGRRTALGGVVTVPEFGSTAWQLGLETGYIVYDNADFTIMPVLGVHYLDAQVDRFSEIGGPGALAVAPQNDSSFLMELGVEFAYAPAHQPWGVEGELGWLHDFENANRPVSASFGGGGGAPFQVIAPGMGEDAFYLDLRGYYDIGDAVRLGLGYRGELRDDSDILNAGDFRVTYTF